MKNRRAYLTVACLASLLGTAAPLQAAPALRTTVNQRGSFLLVGNTLGFDCSTATEVLLDGQAPLVPAPLVGSEQCAAAYPGAETRAAGEQGAADDAPDLYWLVNPPQAAATQQMPSEQARSEAVVEWPADARVTYARLYWAGMLARQSPGTATEPDDSVSFFVPDGEEQYEKTIGASEVWSEPSPCATCAAGTANADFYQASAEVTWVLQGHGPGRYGVQGVSSWEAISDVNEDAFSAWWLVVFYERAQDPVVHLALFDGLDRVQPTTETPVMSLVTQLGGFVAAAGGDVQPRLGLVGYEGDTRSGGDFVRWNGSLISNELNPAYNFFNSTRTTLGTPATVVGDLPQLSGAPRSLAGLDIDQVKIAVDAGAKAAQLTVGSKFDMILLGGFVTAIPATAPVLGVRTKQVTPVDAVEYLPGGLVEYTITVENTGNDAAVGLTLRDPLPAELEFLPGSLGVVSGPGAGALTDTAGDDAAEYDGQSVVVRLGAGATASAGGRLGVGERVVVALRARIRPELPGCEPGESCHVCNQGALTLAGESGAGETELRTDGDPDADGDSDACFSIGGCASDADCAERSQADCDLASRVCLCDPTSGSCADSDGDGVSDGREATLGTNPNDADTDDDGLPDGAEPRPGEDPDGDGLTNANDPDSDNDGLFDGTESGMGCDGPGTDVTRGNCRPDLDQGDTTTSPIDADSDHGGASDGSEDWNLNGRIDTDETDPMDEEDDASVVDSDQDGLADWLEGTLGSNPNDADTDDDGVPDGSEPNPGTDPDGDGLPNVLDPDSDGDLLFDGTEMGSLCDLSATDRSQGHCIPDADAGLTQTSPILLDSDGDGVSDAALDPDHDGVLEGVEPLAASIRGGGCGCSLPGGPRQARFAGWAALLALVVSSWRRRRPR